MNYFQLLVVLLAGAALVSAAAFPRIDANGGYEFGLADSLRVEQMVQEGDDPAALAEMINGCRSLTYNVHLEVILRQMIFRRRHAIFAFLFPLIDFEARVNRNDFLSGILVMALCSNSIQIADFVMSQGDIQPDLVEGRPTWRNSGQDAWNERNMRFSRNPTHLTLGGPDTPREEVEDFYRFWSNFESTRRFDYLDEDEVEGDNREAKRYQEKKNKAARLKRKSEDNARIRQLFEQAYKLDPRIRAHKEADKAAKAAKKTNPAASAGRPQSQAQALAEKKAKEEEAARVAAEAAKAAAAEAKKAKEAEANALRKEKKAFKAIFVEHNYFLADLTNLKAFEEEAVLVEQICNRLGRLEIAEVRGAVQTKVAAKDFGGVTNLLRERLGVALVERPVVVAASMVSAETESRSSDESAWSFKETDLLINGTKKFPGGTVDRWETITEWLNRQLPADDAKSVEQVIAKANEIKAQGVHLAPEAWEAPGKRDPRVDQSEPTIAAYMTAGPWTADEQSALEAAITAIPAEDGERWDKIAKLVASRTKKECMLRAKELATAAKSRQQQ